MDQVRRMVGVFRSTSGRCFLTANVGGMSARSRGDVSTKPRSEALGKPLVAEEDREAFFALVRRNCYNEGVKGSAFFTN